MTISCCPLVIVSKRRASENKREMSSDLKHHLCPAETMDWQAFVTDIASNLQEINSLDNPFLLPSHYCTKIDIFSFPGLSFVLWLSYFKFLMPV